MPMTVAEIVQHLKNRAPLSPTNVTRISSRLVGDVTGTINRVIRAFAPRTAEDILDEWFPWARDQRLAMDPTIPEEQRMAAVHRVASAVPWNPYSHWNRGDHQGPQELHARAAAEGRSPKQVIEEILEEAVLLVLSDRERERRIRVGSGKNSFSIRETEGAEAKVSPADLPYSADPESTGSTNTRFDESPYLYWFYREVQKAATAILLDQPYPPTDETRDTWQPDEPQPDSEPFRAVESDDDPFQRLLESAHYSEPARRLMRAIDQSSPRQQEILRLLAKTGSIAQAAREIGISESTARVQLMRLRKKIAKM